MANVGRDYVSLSTSTETYTNNVPEGSSVEQHLIYLSKTFNALFNAREYEHPFLYEHLSPGVRCDISGEAPGVGVEACFRGYKAIADASPGYKIDVPNASAIVDESKGIGVVLFSQEMEGCSEVVGRMSGAISFTWVKRRKGWVCEKISKMFGAPEFLSEK